MYPDVKPTAVLLNLHIRENIIYFFFDDPDISVNRKIAINALQNTKVQKKDFFFDVRNRLLLHPLAFVLILLHCW